MKINNTIKTELDKIPDEISQKYNIRDYNKKGVILHIPSVINIMFDKNFNVEIGEYTIDISNKTLHVCLWIDVLKMHITIYT